MNEISSYSFAMEETRSDKACKTNLNMITTDLIPIKIYQSMADDDIESSKCCITSNGNQCGGKKKTQKGMLCICKNHVDYYEDCRGWAFIFSKEKDLLNKCRQYGIYNEVIEFANKRANEVQEEINKTKADIEAMNIDDSPAIKEDTGNKLSHEEYMKAREEAKEKYKALEKAKQKQKRTYF